MLHGIPWHCKVLHGIIWYCKAESSDTSDGSVSANALLSPTLNTALRCGVPATHSIPQRGVRGIEQVRDTADEVSDGYPCLSLKMMAK